MVGSIPWYHNLIFFYGRRLRIGQKPEAMWWLIVVTFTWRNFFTGACYHPIIIIIWICLILGYPNLDGQSWSIMVNHGQSWSIMVNHGQSWSIMVNHGQSWSITMFIFDKKRRDPFRFVWKSPRNLLDYQLSSFSFIFPIQIAILGGRNPPFFSTGPMCPPPAMKGRSETAWRDATGRNRSDD